MHVLKIFVRAASGHRKTDDISNDVKNDVKTTESSRQWTDEVESDILDESDMLSNVTVLFTATTVS